MKALIVLSSVLVAAIAIPILEEAETDVTADIKGDDTDLKDHIPVLVGGGETNANVPVNVAMDSKDPMHGKAETAFTNINGDNTDLMDHIPVLVGGGEKNDNIAVPADVAMNVKDPMPGKAETVFTNINGDNTDLKDHIPILIGGGETNANIGAFVEVAKDVQDPTPVSEDTAKDVKDPTSEVDGIPIDEELFMLLAAFADPITEIKPGATR